MEDKIIVAHPGKQHSFQLATALKKNKKLYKYITTVYKKENSITNFIYKFLDHKNAEKAKSRVCVALEDSEVIQYNEFESLLLLLLYRIDKKKKLYRLLDEHIHKSFGKKVARYAIKNSVDAVIMYDDTSKECFEILKKKAPNIKRILDVSTANRLYLKEIYEEDMKKNNNNNLKNEFGFLWKKNNIDKYMCEICNSQYFIVPSNFVKKSYMFSGVNEEKIKVVPYGVDNKKFISNKNNISNKKRAKLNLLFVGQISYYKGLHHLLNVVSSFDKEEVMLNLVGSYKKDSDLYLKYCKYENINFCGFVNFNMLPSFYSEADVFVFPTMGEGFGLVVLEAMSMGLPIICSKNAGGNDVIEEGVNGFIYDPLSENELIGKIEYFIKNYDKIQKMGIHSKKISENYTWDKYYLEVLKAINNIMERN